MAACGPSMCALRPEHVCLAAPPVIFDRVKAALELRMVDVFDAVVYLGAAMMPRVFLVAAPTLAAACIKRGGSFCTRLAKPADHLCHNPAVRAGTSGP